MLPDVGHGVHWAVPTDKFLVRSITMKRSIVLIILCVSLSCLAQVDQDLQAAVTAGNQAWINGMRSGDAAVAASAFAADAINCSADGQCVTGVSAITSQLRSRV